MDAPRQPPARRGFLRRVGCRRRAVRVVEWTITIAFTIEYALARLWMSWGVRPQALEALTAKERKLLTFVAMGLSNKDLAERLSVSTNTVKWHLRNIFEKLQINNRMQAVAVARQMGLVE